MAKNKDGKDNEPDNCWRRFMQQRLHAWQPVMSPGGVVISFYVLSLVMLGIGIGVYLVVSEVKRIKIDYTDVDKEDPPEDVKITDGSHLLTEGRDTVKIDARKRHGDTMVVQFTLPLKEEITGEDVYVYYGLQGFHQNSRRYILSRDDEQIQVHTPEEMLNKQWDHSNCATDGAKEEDFVRYPCGLTAKYIFNDEYLMEHTDSVSTGTPKWEYVKISDSIADIGWYDMEIGSGKFYQAKPDAKFESAQSNDNLGEAKDMQYQHKFYMWIVRQFPPASCVQKHTHEGYSVTMPPLYLARDPNSKGGDKKAPFWSCGEYELNRSGKWTVDEGKEHWVGPWRPKSYEQCLYTEHSDPLAYPLPKPAKKCVPRSRSAGVSGTESDTHTGYLQKIHMHWGIESGHFINWMHIAGTKNFQKLWGLIHKSDEMGRPKQQTIKKNLRVTVYSRFDMSRIEKRKELVITTKSWLGGRNVELAYAYITVGCICLFFSFYFTYCYLRYPRSIRSVDPQKKKS